MIDDENPRSDWLGSGGFAHPDAPGTGSGSSFRHRLSSHLRGGVDPSSP